MKRLAVVALVLLLLCGCSPSSFQVSEIKDLPPHQSDERYERFYPTYVDTFIPSEDYGAVYPYIGQSYQFGSYLGTTYFYGLCTADGRIVCDPVYRYADTLRLGEHLFYVMILSGVTPDPDSPYEHLGQDRFLLIRSDGRYCRTLDGMPYLVTNGDYIQLQIGTGHVTFAYLDANLNWYNGSLTPKRHPDYPNYTYYGICPGCQQSISSQHIARLPHADNPYAFIHQNRHQNQCTLLSLDGQLLATFPIPGQSLYSVDMTSRFLFGTCKKDDTQEYAPTAFIYDRDSGQFADIPSASSVQWLYDDVFLLVFAEDNALRHTLLDLSESNPTPYDMVCYGGDTILFTVRDGIGRTLVDGQEIIRLRLTSD